LSSLPNTHNSSLNKIVAGLRRSWLLQKLAYTFLIGMCVGLTSYWITEWLVLPLIACLLLITLAAWVFSNSKQYQDITANKVLLHLNRQFSECEESAELVLLPIGSLTTLQQLQKNRIQPQIDKLLSSDLGSHFPKYSCKPAMLLSTVALMIFILIEVLPSDFLSKGGATNTHVINDAPKPSKFMRLETKSITVTAPSYTELATQQTKDLNLALIAESTVTWRLQISGADNLDSVDNDEPPNELSIMLPDKQRISLIKQTDNHYQASATLHQSGVYYIAVNNKMLGDIHTITVIADTRPTIRFIAPTETITELAKNAVPKVQAIVSIEDDFGLARVEILASIASGSGEAVKFRDQTFQFDSESVIAKSVNEGKAHFFKNWDLAELGMQPGDELYFSIRAWDNRFPVAQQSRSASKIIRWLEEEQQTVLADGIVMDFMPEYFKSQRQIIIETKELIANRNNVSMEVFNRTSRDLGAAQSFLKQKYGQFLGDEFDSGTHQSMEAGPEIEHDEHEEHANEKSQQPAAGHQHNSAEHQSEDGDISGYSQIIQQFGHAHGEADDGNFIKKGLPSPKLLMKRAIANMWQAELHLQLSEPELALSFENQALAFLNRAKQADRIYVKRLGFEPPPVSEKRRYQGDLSDILSYQRDEQTPANNTPIKTIAVLANMLTNNSEQLNGIPLTGAQKSTLEKVKAYFSAQLTAHPKDITFIATLGKMQQADSFTLKNCQGCINALTEKLWQTLPSPIAAPTTRQTPYSLQNNMLQNYQTFLQQHNEANEKVHKKEQKEVPKKESPL
jgi:hypothetical protein